MFLPEKGPCSQSQTRIRVIKIAIEYGPVGDENNFLAYKSDVLIDAHYFQ